jgi:hypothetical protein
MSIQYKSLTDLLNQVRDNQVHDKDHYEGLSEAEIYQVRQFYMFEEIEENSFSLDIF